MLFYYYYYYYLYIREENVEVPVGEG